MNFRVGVIIRLQFYQPSDRISDTDHSLNAVLCGCRYINGSHTAVLTEIDFIVQNRVGKVSDCRIGRDGIIFFVQFVLDLICRKLTVNVGNGFVKLLGKVCTLKGFAGGFGTETPRHHFHLSEYHFGMLNKVPVHQDTFFIRAELYPIRLYIHNAVTLLQNKNVRNDLRSGITLKGVVRQTDSTKQVGSLSNIFADSGVFLIHRSLAGNESHYAARTELVQRLGEEVVVNEELVFVVTLVRNLEIPEGYIPHNGVKEAVGEVGFFKALCGDRGLLI